MKKLLLIFIFAISFVAVISAQPVFDLQFEVVNNDGTNFDVKVKMKGTPAFGLGSSNIKFNFNNTDLSTPTLLTAHNFSGTLYNAITVSEPVAGIASINIELFVPNAGTEVSTSFTEVATVRFTTINAAGSSQLTFRSPSEGSDPTVVFDDDQATTALPGTLSPLDTTPLPVELSSFSANSVEGVKAQLNWETATEVNNYGFEIERSVVLEDAELEPATWEKVAFVQGHGNSNSNKIYSFTDKNLVGGSKFLYRLKQIDIDGTFEYSDAIEVEVVPSQYELFQNYPNPFNPSTNIKFSLPEDAKVAINIYSILGEKVSTILNDEIKAGYHQVDFNSNSAGYSIASGVYIYTIETKNFSQVKKMILMK